MSRRFAVPAAPAALAAVLSLLLAAGAALAAAPAGARDAGPPAAGSEVAPETVFESEAAGVRVAVPGGWVFQDLQALVANREQIRFEDEEMREVVAKLGTLPLMAATRHPEPHPDLNPSIQLLVRSAGGMEGITARQVLELALPQMSNYFADARVVEEISEVTVDGVPGARATMEYTLATQEGSRYPTRATIVVVLREGLIYQLGFSGPQEGPDVLDGEVEATLASFAFLD